MPDSNDNGKLSASELAGAARTTVEELTGYSCEAVTGLEWDGESWCVTVEALEMARIPNTTDLLGSYEVRLDEGGTMRGFRRVRRFTRSEPRDDE